MSRQVLNGMTSTKVGRKIYRAWYDARSRCYNTEDQDYGTYGAAGVTMQADWIDCTQTFYNYVVNLPGFCISKSLDRLECSKGYQEGNLRWATSKEQSRNKKMKSTNSLGATGVHWWTRSRDNALHARAQYVDIDDRRKVKIFNTEVLGLLPAMTLAIKWRQERLKEINLLGAGYSPDHGK